jgi:PAS domain-containing protein
MFVKLDSKPDKPKDETVNERMSDLLREMEVMTAVVSFSSSEYVVAIDNQKQIFFLNDNAKKLTNIDEIISELAKNKKYIKAGECEGAVESIMASDEVTVYAFRKKELNGDGRILPIEHEYVRGAINSNHTVFGGIAKRLKMVESEFSGFADTPENGG